MLFRSDYAAPEQLRGEATVASDLYSLGVVCLHLLTGLQPFDLFDSGQGGWHWRSIVPDVSPSLAAILDSMVQPTLRDRLADVATAMMQVGLSPTATVPAADAHSRASQWIAEQTVDLAMPILAAVSLPQSDHLLLLTAAGTVVGRSEEHTSELQSQSTISYAVFCLKKKTTPPPTPPPPPPTLALLAYIRY